ncbi:MAG: Rpn family recombination-promoting nuclease/putative transposase [Clostridia bacterium]|nr:Rpn family recombination-promoting nuclease/putative transposase [Clostridia bacterium]
MNVFTYKDYIKCIHTLRLNAVFKLAEESSKYRLSRENAEDKKMIKNILKDKNEMTNFINVFLESKEKIENKNLIRYDSKYISNRHKVDENKLIYKLKNKDTFFILEEVYELDNIVLYEILNYCISIMQEWNITNKIRGENKYPVIVPIIIYAGTKRINNKCIQNKNQIGDFIFKNYNINLNYTLIDINKLSIEFLLKRNNPVAFGMILEKSKDKIELQKNLIKIPENIKNDKKFKKLVNNLNL